jgi:hypothetical protein
MKKNVNRSAVIIDGGKIRFNDIIAVARYGVAVKISKDATFVRKMKKTRDMLMQSCAQAFPFTASQPVTASPAVSACPLTLP